MTRTFRHTSNLVPMLAIAKDVTDALSRGAVQDAWRMARTVRLRPALGAEKIISHKYGFLCLSVPKVASRSIKAALHNIDSKVEVVDGRSIYDLYTMHPRVKDYYSFAFIRHPFSRTLSWYWELFFTATVFAKTYHLYRHKRNRSFFDATAGRLVWMRSPLSELASPFRKEEKSRRSFARHYGLKETAGFEDVCRWLNTPYGSDAFADRHFLSQHVQIRLPVGRLPDFVGRFENINADLGRVAECLGMPAPALPMLNTMAGWQTSRSALEAARARREVQLSERSKALLRTRYAHDVELWESLN